MQNLNSSALDGFNTALACEAYPTVTALPEPTYALVQFVVAMVAAAAVIASFVLFLRYRKRFIRLRKKGMFAPIVSTFGLLLILITRSAYDYTGRQYLPCALDVWLLYLAVLCILPDSITALRLMRLREESEAMSMRPGWAQLVAKEAMQAQIRRRTYSTSRLLLSFYHGFYQYMSCFLQTGSWGLYCELSYSQRRIFAYEMLAMLIMALPSIIIAAARTGTAPELLARNGCTGCSRNVIDVSIILALLWSFMPLWYKFVKHATRVGDPTGVIAVGLVSYPIALVFNTVWRIVDYVDPGGLKQSQRWDPHIIEFTELLLVFFIRIPYQIYSAQRKHRKGFENLSLLELLSDSRGYALFEKFLFSELSAELLVFWTQATKWKVAFSNDLEYAQGMAQVLFRMFIGKRAQMAINISDTRCREIESRFKNEKIVSRTVFDEALIDVYTLMENGPFERFTATKEFAAYRETAADYSLSNLGIFNSLEPTASGSSASSSAFSSASGAAHRQVAPKLKDPTKNYQIVAAHGGSEPAPLFGSGGRVTRHAAKQVHTKVSVRVYVESL